MKKTDLKGIIVPMITPLKGNDELDYEGTVRLVGAYNSRWRTCTFPVRDNRRSSKSYLSFAV